MNDPAHPGNAAKSSVGLGAKGTSAAHAPRSPLKSSAGCFQQPHSGWKLVTGGGFSPFSYIFVVENEVQFFTTEKDSPVYFKRWKNLLPKISEATPSNALIMIQQVLRGCLKLTPIYVGEFCERTIAAR